MKKYELVQAIAEKTGQTQAAVAAVIDAMQPIIADAVIEKGEEVNLPELGKFKPMIRAARKGRNPMTGEALDIPESHNIAFRPTYKLKKVIQPKKAAAAKKSKK